MWLKGLISLPLINLAAIHFVFFLAEFFAPYDAVTQHRQLPYSPPTRIHWVGNDGRLSYPFVYRFAEHEGEFDYFTEDRRIRYPIHAFPSTAKYTIGGVVSWDRRLFGVDAPAYIFVMGSDAYGRDLFSRFLFGGRISLVSAAAATALSLTFGAILGVVAGFYGGWADALIMRCVELFMAIPWLYLLLILRGLLPLHTSPEKASFFFIAVVGLIGWARPARLVRVVVMSAKEQRHLLAARSFGASDFYLARCHIVPEIRGLVLTQSTILVPQYVLAEVALSFFGLGIGEPTPSWGGMLANLQQYHVLTSKWWMFLPGLMCIPVMLSYGLVSRSLHEGGLGDRSRNK
jgi:peptide/nickel transport system permease protein